MTGAVQDGAIRLGVMGCADIARRRTLPAIAETPQVRLVAVASRDPATARAVAEEHSCAAVGGYDALLDRTDLDAVYVPIPVALRRAWVERALRAGLHVLSEKPLTTNRDHAAQLVELAGSRDLVLMENLTFLHHGAHTAVAELLQDGAVGSLRGLSSDFGVPERSPDDIRYDPALGGSALLDVGVYPLRLAQLLLGPRPAVTGAVLHRDPRRGVDVGGSVLLSAPQGAVAQLGFGIGLQYRNRYTCWGTAGTLTLERAFTPPPSWTPEVRLETAAETAAIPLSPDHQFRNTLRAFAAAIREGGEPGRGRRILELAALLDDVRAAADTVDLPLPVGS